MTPNAERPVYVDSSALVKLLVREPETAYLQDLRTTPMATSALALVEVHRAVTARFPQLTEPAERLVRSCLLVSVTDDVLGRARRLASDRLKTLDAIHLATALHIPVAQMITYDRQLIEAAREEGIEVLHPGLA